MFLILYITSNKFRIQNIGETKIHAKPKITETKIRKQITKLKNTKSQKAEKLGGGGGASGGAEKPFNGVQLRSVSPKAQDFVMNMKKREMETSCEDLG